VLRPTRSSRKDKGKGREETTARSKSRSQRGKVPPPDPYPRKLDLSKKTFDEDSLVDLALVPRLQDKVGGILFSRWLVR
jgi:hypothetical protein